MRKVLIGKKKSQGNLKLKVIIFLKIQKYIRPNLIKEKSIIKLRDEINKLSKKMSSTPINFTDIRDIQISRNRIPVRIYTPFSKKGLPIIIYVHGGSWIGGNLDTHDNVCRKISMTSKAIVVSVDYSLAPERPFPHGLNDVYTVIRWAYNNSNNINGRPDCIALVGDSSGGNLCAAASCMAREKGDKYIKCQVLIYPATNIFELNTGSWLEFGNGYILTKENQNKFISLYIKDKKNRKCIYGSPLLESNFKKLPPTFIITGEFDPLRDDGELYAHKLKESGVEVSLKRYKGVIHGFITMDQMFSEADDAIKEISLYLKNQFSKDC